MIAKSQILWLQAPSILHNFDDPIVERMIKRYGKVGLDEFRVGPGWGWEDSYGFYVMPFKRSERTGYWKWNKPDYRWDDNLKRFKKLLWRTKLYPKDPENNTRSRIRLRYSYIDNCLYKGDADCNFWKFNIGGPKGMYDDSDRAFGLFKDYFDRLWDAGIRWYDLGNEVVAPYFKTQKELYEWTRRYVVRHLNYLMDKGAKPLFTFSADERTGHAYRGIIADEIKPNIICQVLHGQMIPEKLPPKGQLWHLAKIGISCDGLNTKHLPLYRQGLCTANKRYCDSSVKEHMKSCKKLHEMIGDRFRFWEHLPRTIDDKQSPNKLKQHCDISVVWRVPKHVYGVDVRR